MTEAERELANKEIVDRVREGLELAFARLDPEVEPALVYRINDDTGD